MDSRRKEAKRKNSEESLGGLWGQLPGRPVRGRGRSGAVFRDICCPAATPSDTTAGPWNNPSGYYFVLLGTEQRKDENNWAWGWGVAGRMDRKDTATTGGRLPTVITRLPGQGTPTKTPHCAACPHISGCGQAAVRKALVPCDERGEFGATCHADVWHGGLARAQGGAATLS